VIRCNPHGLGVLLGVSISDVGVSMLSDAAIRKAKPRETSYKLSDGGGLFLLVSAAGGKLWRFKYRMAGKERLLSIGAYPGVSLADARTARDRAKELLREGKDPSQAKRLKRFKVTQQVGETFEKIAREWVELNRSNWVKVHADDVQRSLARDVFPAIGDLPIRDIKAAEILALLRKVEGRGARETARRIRQRIGCVFTYAIASDRADANPAALLEDALAPVVKGRQPAIVDLEAARKIIRDVDASPGHPVTKLAIRLLALTAVRPGVIATTPWSELPPGITCWTVPAARMKLRKHMKDDEARDHLVPLSRQAVEVIEALRTITGRGPNAFPNVRHPFKPMSENAMGYMLNRAGYHGRHVPHGWRSTFSTVMNERYPEDRHIIDFMLAHTLPGKTEAAYNRALYIKRRTELAQIWADLLIVDMMPPLDITALPRR
jgi:integrase